MDQAQAKHLFEPTGDFQCLHEFIPAARAKLSDHIWGYLVGATETETSLRRNRLAIDSLALRPRVCVDVSKIDLNTTLFGRKVRLPLILAPVGSLESFHPGGAATAGRAASAFGVPIMVSSVTQPGLEESAAAATGPKIFQLYVRGDNAWVDDVAKRAVDAGYDAFAITVDTAGLFAPGARYRRAFCKAVARRRDGSELPGRVYLGQRQALQGQSQHPADPEGHRHRRGCRALLRVWRRLASMSPTMAAANSITEEGPWMYCRRLWRRCVDARRLSSMAASAAEPTS